MKKLVTLILALSGMAAFAVTAADFRVKPFLVSTAAQGPIITQAVAQPSLRHILLPDGQTSSCKDANWPYISVQCLERETDSGV